MTNHDPAIEAAERARANFWKLDYKPAIYAAREALNPIRLLIEVSRNYGDYVRISELAPLVYSTEELSAWTARNNELKGAGA